LLLHRRGDHRLLLLLLATRPAARAAIFPIATRLALGLTLATIEVTCLGLLLGLALRTLEPRLLLRLRLGLRLELTSALLTLSSTATVALVLAFATTATAMVVILRESCRRHQGRGCHDRGKH
jgi:hypothetical protein